MIKSLKLFSLILNIKIRSYNIKCHISSIVHSSSLRVSSTLSWNGSKPQWNCSLGWQAAHTAGLNTIQQSANVSLASTSLWQEPRVVGTDRQSVRPTRDRPDRVRASQTESDPVRPGQTRPEQARAGCDCQPGWLKASRPHPHTSLFLCRLWWYDLNDNDDGSASQRQREGQVGSEGGWR